MSESNSASEPSGEALPRCPDDGRVLVARIRLTCPRCTKEYRDSPKLYGAPAPRNHAPEKIGGEPINMKLGDRLQFEVEALAKAEGKSRAKMIRELLADGLRGRDGQLTLAIFR